MKIYLDKKERLALKKKWMKQIEKEVSFYIESVTPGDKKVTLHLDMEVSASKSW